MRVALFVTCLADQLFPELGLASVKLLRHLGVDIEFPEAQTCCGQPAYNAGYLDETKEIAEHHIGLFTDYDYVVLPSGSCGAMVKTHYPEMFRESAKTYEASKDLANRTYELTSFITEVLEKTDIGSNLSGKRVTYHDSCHALRYMNIKESPRILLKTAGAELIEAANSDVCCGFGGLFSVKMPEISAAMARAKTEGIIETKADILSSTDGGCLMNIAGSMRRENVDLEVKHVVELLWEGIEHGN